MPGQVVPIGGRQRLLDRFLTTPAMPVVLLGVIAALDLAATGHHPIWIRGLLDEPAHAATATIVLLAFAGPARLARWPKLFTSTVLFSVAIDVDHIPFYAGLLHTATGGRPGSHALLTVLVLASIGLVHRRRRLVWLSAAAGVTLHFVRDVATGPGLVLLWPASSVETRVPYASYLALLAALAAVSVHRITSFRHSRRHARHQPQASPRRRP